MGNNSGYRASLAYNYANTPKNYQPFEKIIKSNSLKLLKDFNFTLMPNAINFRIDVDEFGDTDLMEGKSNFDDMEFLQDYINDF